MGQSNGKFIIDIDSALYKRLHGFVCYLAYHNQNPNNVMMAYDEIVSDLTEEMLKGLAYYSHLPPGQLEAAVKKVISNRLGELKYRHYKTHRQAQNSNLSLDAVVGDDITIGESVSDDTSRPEAILDSRDRVINTRDRLSATAKEVFDAVIFGDERLELEIRIGTMRSNSIFKEPKIYLKSWQIADALDLADQDVKDAFKEIRKAYVEVLNGK